MPWEVLALTLWEVLAPTQWPLAPAHKMEWKQADAAPIRPTPTTPTYAQDVRQLPLREHVRRHITALAREPTSAAPSPVARGQHAPTATKTAAAAPTLCAPTTTATRALKRKRAPRHPPTARLRAAQ